MQFVGNADLRSVSSYALRTTLHQPQRGDMYIEKPNLHIPKPQRGDMCTALFLD